MGIRAVDDFGDRLKLRLALLVAGGCAVAKDLGDFCQNSYHLACLFACLLRRVNSYIVRLCACCPSLKTNENPARSGMSFSDNRLTTP